MDKNNLNKISGFYQILILSLLLAVVLSTGSCSRLKENKFTIGIVSYSGQHEDIIRGFKDEINSSLGPDEKVEYLYSGPLKGDSQAAQAELSRFVKEDVDLVFTLTTPATKLALKILKDTSIPIVFTPVYDPVRAGLVEHLVNHESNITGVKIGGSTSKALSFLLEIKPDIKKIFAPNQVDSAPSNQSLAELKKAAEIMGLEIIDSQVGNGRELDSALAEMPFEADALWLLHSPMLVSNVEKYVQSAVEHKLPIATSTDLYSEGALLSYGPDSFSIGKQVGELAYKICRGVSPADLPVETAEFFLGVNLVTARKIGLDISQEFLMLANFIIPLPADGQ